MCTVFSAFEFLDGAMMATRGKAPELPAEARISFLVNEPVEAVEELK